MHAIIHDPAPPLQRRPLELQEILDKILAKDPKDRYQHSGDLALDLRRFEQRPPAARQSASAAGNSRQLIWIAAAVILLAVSASWWALTPKTSTAGDNPLA